MEDNTLFQGSDVFIIGNGFDLDLGLKTSYHDFYVSDDWPFNKPNTLMGAFLNHERSINNWMDLESKMGEYAIRSYCDSTNLQNEIGSFSFKHNDFHDNEKLRNGLEQYLIKAEGGAINKQSTAATVLAKYMNSFSIPTIISFNYTDIQKIARNLDIQTVFSFFHIHGSLLEHNIILGVGENYYYNNINLKLPQPNDFFYKTSSPNYNPPQIADLLNKSTNLTFFGLSLGGMDAPYFSGLFQNLSKQSGKRITIFTYDEESRLQILRHLRNVEGLNLNDVWTRHQIEFIRTKDNIDKEKVANYLQRIDVNNPILDA